ncbi:hypothetical protein CRUP_016654 [Coryphaenoides rupestris]|nr:hypothetical protein CRUP_016654 [Coryphaenoides rupestris]
MSDVVEKTLTALPALLSLDSQPGKLSSGSKLGNLIQRHHRRVNGRNMTKRNLFNVNLCPSKEQVSSPNTSMRQMKELMVRAIYCEMLVTRPPLATSTPSNWLSKARLWTRELDLQSTNLIEVCMALTVVGQIFPKDMIPAILPLVEEKLNHPKEIIRRKAVLALYKFYLIAPNQVQHIHNKFRKALCDKDPGVMRSRRVTKTFTLSFVTILKQVVGGKLPIDFNYHSIQLLRILSLLGKNDRSTVTAQSLVLLCLRSTRLKALTYVVQQDAKPGSAAPDDHHRTLELLFRITNGQNVKVIVEKLLDFLRLSKDDYVTIDLGGKVAELAEKYPSTMTMNTVFLLVGDQMQPDIPNSFLRLLSEGSDSIEEDRQLRLLAVESYLSLLQDRPAKLPQRFLQVISWPVTVLRLLGPAAGPEAQQQRHQELGADGHGQAMRPAPPAPRWPGS